MLKNDYAKRPDHRKLGLELDLFTFSELVGSGLPLWTPKGTILRNLLDEFVWELREKRNYERVEIPHITKKELYEHSGHWDKFKDELFQIKTREGYLFAVKPMNCPHHTQIYARKSWSYREIPQRYANTTMCYRDEQTGELAGLSRVRAFTQDDAHVFCNMDQIKGEFLKIWDIVHEFYTVFGFNRLRVRFSRHDPEHPEKYLGEKTRWVTAENVLREIIQNKEIEFVDGVGEAAFYGPKLDFIAKDSLDREWQIATIQIDLNMPERFNLTYTNNKGEQEKIAMIHAAIMGSIERFLAILLEHTGGVFPLWLSPVQVVILPLSKKFSRYAEGIYERLKRENIRVEVASIDETLSKRIREAEMQKTPYILVAGQREARNKMISVRHYRRGEEGEISIEELIGKLKREIKEKAV